ncbi:MAG TPA: CRTAC1 family protein [Flavobacteriales bacterium]|nr:CRTAC1 family protein [Flavobacteriales bacterium]HRP81976.1 CRTAC1 family protein [Flavobacteriales bacterium]
MRATSTLLVSCLLPALAVGQTFTLSTNLLSYAARSGGCIGVADMDGDGYDDLVMLDKGTNLYVDYQAADGSFSHQSYGQASSSAQWGMAVGAVSGDGHKDYFSGANGDGVHFLQITGRGQSAGWASLNNGSIFMQCANMADINNDGALDAFGCGDTGPPKIWLNNGTGSLAYNNYIDFSSTPSSDMSGNYGSVWIDVDNDGDLDLFIAKCRQGVNNSNDPRRWNRLFINDGNNNFTDQVDAHGLTNHEQSWSADFGDIDNDGDLDLVVTNHNRSMQLYINDGTGHFTEATVGSGINKSAAFLQVKLVDLDNDGFLDLITSGNLGGSAEYYFHGNGDGTFTQILNMLPEPGTWNLHTFAVGDLNHDGFIDVYAGYGSSYVNYSSSRYDQLYLNDGNSNHFINFNLRGQQSNPDGVGARVTVYGPWGTQIREVRAGESYGIVCSFTNHFGLGSATVVDSAIVRWPSGIVDKYYGLQADQWVTVQEGETRTAVVAAKVLLDGPFVSGTGMMKDDLRVQGLIPATEPYTAMGFAAIGDGLGRELTAAVLAVTGNNAIVDWVWLELRSASNLSNVVAARAVLLQRDGDVVELDGKSPVNMHVPPGNYHLAIRHRNHLGVLTAAASSLSGNATVIDLSSSATATWGTNARKSAGTARTLWSGDTNRDGTVKYTGVGNDRDKVLSTIGGAGITGTLSGYHLGDANMNGVVSYTGQSNDRDLILVNIGGVSPTAVLMEQLP